MTVKVTKPAINVREELADLRKPTGIAGEAMLRAETPQEQFNLIGAGRRRINLNGGMTVWQRGNGPTAAINATCSTADRWSFFTSGSGGAYTTERSTGHLAETGHDTALKVAVTTADTSIAAGDYYSFLQRIEAQDVQQLQYGTSSAKHMTFSFWVRASKTGTNTVFLSKDSGTVWRFVREFTINHADTWEYKTITFPPLTASSGAINNDNGLGIQIGWILKYGSAYTAGGADVWTTSSTFSTSNAVNNMDTVGNTFYVTGVQLEVGKVATPFEHRSYGEELAACQRYYQQYGGGSAYHGFFVAGSYSTSTASGYFELSGHMRAPPTGSATGTFEGGNGPTQTATLTNFSPYSEHDGSCKLVSIRVNGNGSSYITGGFLRVRAQNDITARIKFDAEL